MFNILVLKIALALIATAIAAYTDHKTGLIQNWLTYPLIGVGLLITVFESFLSVNTFGWIYFADVLAIGILIYLIGYFMYKYGKLGGGDVKLFLGLHLLIPYYLGQLTILWLLIFSSLLSVFCVSIFYMLKLSRKITVKDAIKILGKRKSLVIKAVALFLVFFVAIHLFVIRFDGSWQYYLTLLPILLGLKAVIFEQEIKKYIYLKNKKISELEDGDVIAIDFIKKDLLGKLGLKGRFVIEDADIRRIKKMKNIRSIPIFDNLPRFAPYIFFGLIVVLLFL